MFIIFQGRFSEFFYSNFDKTAPSMYGMHPSKAGLARLVHIPNSVENNSFLDFPTKVKVFLYPYMTNTLNKPQQHYKVSSFENFYLYY